MSATTIKASKRDLRRALGPEAAELLAAQHQTIAQIVAILRRGFWGRAKWLLFGK